jgi:hypothetical protein
MDGIEFNFPDNEETWEFELDLLSLFDDGLIETCGVNEKGEVLLRATEKGELYIKSLKEFDD